MVVDHDLNRAFEGWNFEENILSVTTLIFFGQGPDAGPMQIRDSQFRLTEIGSFEPFGCTCSALTLILLDAETRDLECLNAGGFSGESIRQ